MKFTVVTPTFNRPEFLDDTIRSVVDQAGDFEIQYIVQDGGSDEGVLQILRAWKALIDSGNHAPKCHRLTFEYYVESDSGMYDAINRGFARGTGDVMAWINSDDLYLPNAFAAVASALDQHWDVDWVIGHAVSLNDSGTVIDVRVKPKAYSRELVRRGLYRQDIKGMRWIPQDAVFWRKSLWDQAGPLDTQFRLVSDFRLWQKFAEHAEPVRIAALTGAYRNHGNQLTANAANYPAELGPQPRQSTISKTLFSICTAQPWLARWLISGPTRSFARLMFGTNLDDLFGRHLWWDTREKKWCIMHSRIFS